MFEEMTAVNGNQVDAGPHHGKVDATKMTFISEFPSALCLLLKRFISEKNVMKKINDRFEFDEIINLDKYSLEDDNVSAEYALYAVLVHSGTHLNGHYLVYIKINGAWNCFDDAEVTKCSREEAVQNNFGCLQRDKNAYMLVYVRNTNESRSHDGRKGTEISSKINSTGIEISHQIESEVHLNDTALNGTPKTKPKIGYFFRAFERETKTLHRPHLVMMDISKTYAEIRSQLCALVGWKEDTELTLYKQKGNWNVAEKITGDYGGNTMREVMRLL